MNSIVSISTTALYIKYLFCKLEIFLDNCNIYFCIGEHDDNIICLHKIDWKIKMNNRHISLMLFATLKIVSCRKKLLLSSWWQYTYCKLTTSTPTTPKTCFDWVWISTTIRVWHIFGINYQLQVPKWILIKVMKLQSNTFRWKYKYITTTLITIYAQLLKETLHCIIPLFISFLYEAGMM